MAEEEEQPVLSGLVALVAVAVVVGLLAGIAALFASRLVGVDGSSGGGGSANGEPAAGDTLYLPDPVPTDPGSGPLVTLAPTDGGSSSSSASESATDKPKKNKKPKKPKTAITLSQGAFEVGPGEQLYLSGIYPGGEGSVLDIQNRVGDGSWQDFPVDVSVSDETFTTYVQTGQTGTIEWRVVDKSRKLKSNVVRVRHG